MKHVSKLICALAILPVPVVADVFVSTPTNGAAVTSPVQFVASGTSGNVVTAVQIYVDGALAYTGYAASIDTSLALAAGWHYVEVKSWDSTGASWSAPMNIDVVGTANPGGGGGVSISAPQDGAAVGSPVHVVASGNAPGGAIAMQIYSDGNLVYTGNGASIDTQLSMPAGWHNLAVKAWGSDGWSTYSTVNVNVQNQSPASAPPPSNTASNAINSIQQQPNWSSCSSCAGRIAVPYSMTEGISSPSLSGSAAQFWLGGSTPYSNALWWKELSPVSAANFQYDVDFYVDNPSAVQALEFDVNQVIGGYRYIFGTECDIRDTRTWHVWDTLNGAWVSTGIGCSAPAAGTWNHLTWVFQRTPAGQANFVSVTLNGVTNQVNRSFWVKPNGGQELNVAFQMDGNFQQVNYSTWLDNVSLSYW